MSINIKAIRRESAASPDSVNRKVRNANTKAAETSNEFFNLSRHGVSREEAIYRYLTETGAADYLQFDFLLVKKMGYGGFCARGNRQPQSMGEVRAKGPGEHIVDFYFQDVPLAQHLIEQLLKEEPYHASPL